MPHDMHARAGHQVPTGPHGPAWREPVWWGQLPPVEPVATRCSVLCCSVAQLRPTLWDLMNRSTPGFLVLHHLLELLPWEHPEQYEKALFLVEHKLTLQSSSTASRITACHPQNKWWELIACHFTSTEKISLCHVTIETEIQLTGGGCAYSVFSDLEWTLVQTSHTESSYLDRLAFQHYSLYLFISFHTAECICEVNSGYPRVTCHRDYLIFKIQFSWKAML